jgi:hypothetical protein
LRNDSGETLKACLLTAETIEQPGGAGESIAIQKFPWPFSNMVGIPNPRFCVGSRLLFDQSQKDHQSLADTRSKVTVPPTI